MGTRGADETVTEGLFVTLPVNSNLFMSVLDNIYFSKFIQPMKSVWKLTILRAYMPNIHNAPIALLVLVYFIDYSNATFS